MGALFTPTSKFSEGKIPPIHRGGGNSFLNIPSITRLIFEISKMHWWPWPMLFIGMMLSQLLILLSPIFGVIVYGLIMIVFAVMVVIWHWKTFEAVGKPGWWILIPVVLGIVGILVILASPIIGPIIMLVGLIAYLVLVGLSAWGTSGKASPAPKIKKV